MYKYLALVLAILVGCIRLSLAQTGAAEIQNAASIEKWGLPDSPTGRASARFLETIEKEDPAHTRRFIETVFEPSFRDAFSMEHHLGMFRQMYSELADPELISAQKISSSSCDLVIRSQKHNQRFSARLKIEEASPYRITSISVEPMKVKNSIRHAAHRS